MQCTLVCVPAINFFVSNVGCSQHPCEELWIRMPSIVGMYVINHTNADYSNDLFGNNCVTFCSYCFDSVRKNSEAIR